MLSRIAENIYWLGRYVERAENTARLLDVNYHALMEAPLVPGAADIVIEQWAPLLVITETETAFRQYFERADAQNVPYWMSLHEGNVSSIRSSLAYARENARTLRGRISTEMWEAINRTYLALCIEVKESLEEDKLHSYCVEAREASHLFFGIADATLPRDLGWYFMRAGQYLERADNTLRTLMVRHPTYEKQAPVAEGIELHRGMALLKSLSAFEAFRRHSHDGLAAVNVAEFLLLEPNFPRSVRFSVRVLHEILLELATRNPDVSTEARRKAGWLSAQLEHLEDVSAITEKREPSLESILAALADISDTLSGIYFSTAPLAQLQSQTQS